MTTLHIRRCACPCDGAGCCGRLAGEAVGDNDFHQSPTPTARPARRHLPELIASDRPPLGLLHSIWRIRSRGIVNFVMIDRAFVARLWKRIGSAVQEFKISRMQKRSDKRFRVVEVSKGERRRFSSSGSRAPLSARCIHLKRSVRRRARQAASTVACPIGAKIATASWGLISSRRAEEANDDDYDTEEDSVTDESAPINWTRWKEIEIGQFSPQIGIAAFSSSKSMEEFDSLKWEEDFLTTSASTKSALPPGDSSSGTSLQWENRYRISNKSPQLLQPVRGKLTTLSGLLRTMSDRYARRTGKLIPVNDKFNNSSRNKRPVLTQSQSAAPWPMQSQQSQNQDRANSRAVDDVPAKRYDNPFQDFLRQSFAERHSRSVHDTDRQRSVDSRLRTELGAGFESLCDDGGVPRYSCDATHLWRRAEYSSNTFVFGSYSNCDVMS